MNKVFALAFPSLLISSLCAQASDGGDHSTGGNHADWWARGLALFGVFMVVLNFVWDWYKFRAMRKEREQDRAEKIEASLHASISLPHWSLRVRVVNKSDFAVYLRRVMLCSKEPSEDGTSKERFSGVFFHSDSSMGENIDLEQRRDASFSRSGDLKQDLAWIRHLAALPPDKIWISVSSSIGEIARIEGKDVLATLRSVAERMDEVEVPGAA